MSARPRRMPERLVTGVLLVVMWVALWGTLSVANVVSGIAVVLLLMAVFPPVGRRPSGSRLSVRHAVSFAAYFVVKLVQANVVVARIVLARRDLTRPGIVAVRLRSDDDVMSTLVSSFITLTPGTLTLEVREDPRTLYVHVMQLDDVEAVRREVAEIEARAIRAFGSQDARDALAREAVR